MVAVDPEHDLLTVAEAARVLKVSAVTIHRWLKQGRFPSYHLGPRYIRIRRSDLGAVLKPAGRSKTGGPEEDGHDSANLTIRPLTDEEVERGLAALDSSERLIEQIKAQRRGKQLPSSWKLIRRARAER